MVRLGRFELPTSCFGGTRSIHLSYSRVVPLYHAFQLKCIGAWEQAEGKRWQVAAHLPGVSFTLSPAAICKSLLDIVGNDESAAHLYVD